MVGQEHLKQVITRMTQNNFPQFTIIAGPKGSGKKTLGRYIAKLLKAEVVVGGVKVAEIRELIKVARKQRHQVVYILPDTDRMNLAAKNALLKITEEPPAKAFFIMTIEDMVNTLPTLKSRGNVVEMGAYTPAEIQEYWHSCHREFKPEELDVMLSICRTPGDCNILATHNIMEFNNYIIKVINNIGRVSGANAFKIPAALKYKEDDEGYEIELFLMGMRYNYLRQMREQVDKRNHDSITIIGKYLQELKINGINKKMTMDMFILEMRGVWV